MILTTSGIHEPPIVANCARPAHLRTRRRLAAWHKNRCSQSATRCARLGSQHRCALFDNFDTLARRRCLAHRRCLARHRRFCAMRSLGCSRTRPRFAPGRGPGGLGSQGSAVGALGKTTTAPFSVKVHSDGFRFLLLGARTCIWQSVFKRPHAVELTGWPAFTRGVSRHSPHHHCGVTAGVVQIHANA